MDSTLATFVQEMRIPIFGIADPDGFKVALPGWHPRDLMPHCRSVIIFGRPFETKHPYVVEERHIADDAWWEANEVVDHELAKWRGELMHLLDMSGLAAANFGGYGPTAEPTFSYRLAQHEAGVGVYGRFGVCLNPEFGCYYKVGVLLTDAAFIPTSRERLGEFSPCEGCKLCAEACPVHAIDSLKAPALGYNRDLCSRFIFKMKKKHGESVKICARCFSVCPWGWERQAAALI